MARSDEVVTLARAVPVYGAPLAVAGGMDALVAQLRAEFGPIAPVQVARGVGAWLVLDYHAVLDVLRDADRFSSDPRRRRPSGAGGGAADGDRLRQAAGTDGTEHQRLRGGLADALEPLRPARLGEATRLIAEGLISRFAPTGQAEIAGQFARPLAHHLTARILGLAPAEADALHRLTEARPAPGAPDPVLAFAEAVTAQRRLNGDAAAAPKDTPRRRRAVPAAAPAPAAPATAEPSGGVLGRLLEDPALRETEVRDQVAMLAAHAPLLGDLVTHTVAALVYDPVLRAAMAGGGVRPADAVEAALWRHPPLAVADRYATRTTRMGRALVRAGDHVLVGIAAAHTDPGLTGDGVRAGQRAHLAFGAGAHRCPAHHLAATIATHALTALLQALPDLHPTLPADRLRHRLSLATPGLEALPVAFTPVRDPGRPPVPEPAPPDVSNPLRRPPSHRPPRGDGGPGA
ncbi:cytochrome P450 [Allonocardiopsis opalescens]|uniref:Cytochrome P450 n=1 Tax=Allonocardiopsis opalescens TaxID=1144618 RepID=A0A2T0QF22_9ACTN|nr:cytochrome P450 [Allonocardiopsis opalescens]PRY02519.1 cytochrome P450 [Allonocardiopsis opalescens]